MNIDAVLPVDYADITRQQESSQNRDLSSAKRKGERNKLLDGWRGVVVCLMLTSHFVNFRFDNVFKLVSFRDLVTGPLDISLWFANILIRVSEIVAQRGMDIFFVMSGYIITKLMISEHESNDRISIQAFYVRRIFRIVPAFFLYIGVLVLLSAAGIIDIPAFSFLWAGLFLCDTPDAPCTWWLGHTWTLSISEQFYLVWPLIFVFFGRDHLTKVLCIIILMLILFSLVAPYPLDLHAMRFCDIAAGALLASSARLRSLVISYTNPAAILVLISIVLLTWFFVSLAPPHIFHLLVAPHPFMVAVVFFCTINNIGPLARLVSLKFFQTMGTLSYSLYIWQQLSTSPSSLHHSSKLLEIPFLFIVPAVLSYFLLERPLIAMGHRLSSRIILRQEQPKGNSRPKNHKAASMTSKLITSASEVARAALHASRQTVPVSVWRRLFPNQIRRL